jgi:hypothetical protein
MSDSGPTYSSQSTELPPPTASPTSPTAPSAPSRRTVWHCVGLGVATILFAVLWLTTRSDLSSTKSDLHALQNAEAARTAKEDAVPDVLAVAQKDMMDSEIDFGGSSDGVSITIPDSDAGTGIGKLDVMLSDLGFSSAVSQRMGKTRALDGTQHAEGRHCNASWTYHPDDGLQVVFETEKP